MRGKDAVKFGGWSIVKSGFPDNGCSEKVRKGDSGTQIAGLSELQATAL